jgi:Zn finger protein HypA/HybF involved in hydrogenase expression
MLHHIEHLVKGEYDIFVMLILKQLFCNTSRERALIKDEETQITCQQCQRDFMRIINGHQNEIQRRHLVLTLLSTGSLHVNTYISITL